MVKMSKKLKEMNDYIGSDELVKKGKTYIAREGFYYKFGKDERNLINKIKRAYPNAVILNSGEKNAIFKGGARLSTQSHWYVEFKLGKTINESFDKLMLGGK